MTYLIILTELDGLNEAELRSKHSQILDDLARKQQQAQQCPLTMLSLRNIQDALRRTREHAQQSRFTKMPEL